MSLETHQFEFGDFVLDPNEKVLLRQGKSLPITPKIFQLLLVLVENHGHLVEKDLLMQKVWPDSFVEESNLTFSIRQLRKALSDDRRHPHFIETVPRRGYRFIARVSERTANGVSTNGSLNEIESAHAVAGGNRSVLPRIGDAWYSRPVFYSLAAIVAVTLILTLGFLMFRGPYSGARPGTEPSDLKSEAVVSSDRYTAGAISPDGKFIAYIATANGQQSLWLRQLSSGLNTQIVAPEQDVRILLVRFSNDGEYVYFTRRYKDEPTHLDLVSIFGGVVRANIIDGIGVHFSLSPDGQLVSFEKTENHVSSLVVTKLESHDSYSIFETTQTITGNVFSPDGKTIAFATGTTGAFGRDYGVYMVDAGGGEPKPATDLKWNYVRGVEWLPDQSGLLVTAQTTNQETRQLWEILLPEGKTRKITNSQNNLSHLSVTHDLSQILVSQNSLTANLYIAPTSSPDDARAVTQAYLGLSWTPGGDLVYSSSSGNNDIWQLTLDGMKQKQLTTESSMDFGPRVSPDGRYVVFLSDRAGKLNLWRINSDGGNPVQLTNGEGESNASFSPDGHFVLFASDKDDTLWRVPIEGGQPERLSDRQMNDISLSPDGRRSARFEGQGRAKKIVIESFPAAAVLNEFSIPEGYFAGHEIAWSRDGTAVIYSAGNNVSTSNLWKQPLDGAPPQKLTNYDSKGIFFFDFSPDGSKLALIRGSWSFDLVLVKGFR